MLFREFSSNKMHLFGICLAIIGIRAYSISEQPCINLIEDSWNVGSEDRTLANQIFQQAGQLSLYSTSSLTELQNTDIFKPLLRIPHGIDIINRILIAIFRCDQAFINSKFQFIEGGTQQQEYMTNAANNFQQHEINDQAETAKYVPMSAPPGQIPAQQRITQAQGQPMQPVPRSMQVQPQAMVRQPQSFSIPHTAAAPNPVPLYAAAPQIPMSPQAPLNQVPVMYMPQPSPSPAQPLTVPIPPPAPMAFASAPTAVPSPPPAPLAIASSPPASIAVSSPPTLPAPIAIAAPPSASIPAPSPPPAPIAITTPPPAITASSPPPVPFAIASPSPAQLQPIPFMMLQEPAKLQVVPQPPVQHVPVIVRPEPAQVQVPLPAQESVQTYQQPFQKVPVMFVPVPLPTSHVKPRPEVVRSPPPPPVPQLRPRCRLVCN